MYKLKRKVPSCYAYTILQMVDSDCKPTFVSNGNGKVIFQQQFKFGMGKMVALLN